YRFHFFDFLLICIRCCIMLCRILAAASKLVELLFRDCVHVEKPLRNGRDFCDGVQFDPLFHPMLFAPFLPVEENESILDNSSFSTNALQSGESVRASRDRVVDKKYPFTWGRDPFDG